MKGWVRRLLWIGGVMLFIAALAAGWWFQHFRRYYPKEVMRDLRAAVAARNDPHPVERFLESRYGPLTEASNRQEAFLDFFNVNHIEALQIMASHVIGTPRQTNITEMAEWVANYRKSMTADEKQALRARLNSAEGRRMLENATAKYLSQDVRYRGVTAVVIEELMATLSEVNQP